MARKDLSQWQCRGDVAGMWFKEQTRSLAELVNFFSAHICVVIWTLAWSAL